jgi:menaquinone-dependent protoporphyrinogen IX oxidase
VTTAGPRVLVAVASRHGATQQIAAALARDLPETPAGKAAGLSAVLASVESRPDPAPFDAVLLGSAVYAGRWLEPAREYAAAHTAALRERAVWLFSSGPIGAAPFPSDEAHDVAPTAALLGARGHRVFPGRLDLSLLGFGERAMATAMRAPAGDSRDWDQVRRWAEEVAAELTGPPG